MCGSSRGGKVRMQRRLGLLTLVIMLVLGGLIAGLFSGSIQSALTLPAMAMMDQSVANNHAPLRPTQTAHQGTTAAGKGLNGTQQSSVQSQMAQGTPILAQDTFQRTNQALWGQSSDGRQWDGDANVQKAFSIQNATGQITGSTNSTFNALLGSAQNNVNVLATGSVSRFGNGVNLGVVLRYTDANNWYKALIDGNHLSILKRVQGVSTQIRTVPFIAQSGRVYAIRFQSIGAMLFAKVWRNDLTEPTNWMIVTSDMDLTNGQSGLRAVVNQGTVINITSFLAISAQMGNDS